MPHHRLLLSEMIEDLDHVAAKITRIEQTIEQQMQPFQKSVNTWLTVPGIKHRLAWTRSPKWVPRWKHFRLRPTW